jgi:hypothetical protein
MIIGISDMSQYYPGEKNTYGGRAIGINQDGKNIALDENGKWLGGDPAGEYYLFSLESPTKGVEARFSGRITVNGEPFVARDGNGGIAIADFDGDGQLEAIPVAQRLYRARRKRARFSHGLLQRTNLLLA